MVTQNLKQSFEKVLVYHKKKVIKLVLQTEIKFKKLKYTFRKTSIHQKLNIE